MKSRFRMSFGRALALVLVAGLAVGAWCVLRANQDIFGLLLENRRMREALARLTEERQIGYAKVLSQRQENGRLVTRLLFVETDRRDENRIVASKELEVPGDIVHFDALMVTFDPQLVADGRARSLYLWRRIYSDSLAPENGVPLTMSPGEEPKRYADILDTLPVRDRKLFWSEIWQLANDRERLRRAGVRAVYGNAVYWRMQPGRRYLLKLDNGGRITPEAVLDP